MKARKKNSNNEWKEVKYVQLEDSDILYKQEYLEFDNSERTPEQIVNEAHWQDVRERAAIAAMQGILANTNTYDVYSIIKESIKCADALVKQLKEQNNEKN